MHTIEHQDHALCGKSDTPNFHECELDCVFLKYNLQQCFSKSQNYNLNIQLVNNFEIPALTYQFFYGHRILSFSLRGPPILV